MGDFNPPHPIDITETDVPPYDVRDLATSTVRAHEVLKPWYSCKETRSEGALERVNTQVQRYIKALNDSMDAAACGFTIADHVIIYITKLKSGRDYTEEQRAEYAEYILDYANQGHEKANSATNGFRGVRRKLKQAIEDTCPDRESMETSMKIQIQALADGLGVLEQFEVSVTAYAEWWNFMLLRNDSLQKNPKIYFITVTRDIAVEQWRLLQVQYNSYTLTLADVTEICLEMNQLSQAKGSILQKAWGKLRRTLSGDGAS
ncbi:hypothetical protein BJ165DRAFT_1530886 [Panaeolus papilionaceus]|nr:hypothetical protein BJ165DRAFT_1530886 [Panaeolus papilionaceus]